LDEILLQVFFVAEDDEMIRTAGKHLLLELSGCCADTLNNRALVRSALLAAASAAGATVVGETIHGFTPHGLTALLLLAESHLSIHTWPEAGYAAVDVYTCGDCQPEAAIEILAQHLRSERIELMWIARGAEGAGMRMSVRDHSVFKEAPDCGDVHAQSRHSQSVR
jgi:S-adenosylmethionine decarboxylase